MRKRPHKNSKMTRHQHELVDRKKHKRIFGAFGALWNHSKGREIVVPASNPVHTVLLVPELRKRRSERDPELLKEQQKAVARV